MEYYSKTHEFEATISGTDPVHKGTIPLLPTTIDDLVQFVPYHQNSRYEGVDRFINRIAHFRVMLIDRWGENIIARTPGIGLDADNTLLLFAEFGELNSREGLPEGLAVCGFNVREVKSPKRAGDKEYIFELAQFHTGYQPPDRPIYRNHKQISSEKIMLEELGYIKYKEVFAHILEQMALFLHTQGAPVTYVGVEQQMRSDVDRSWVRSFYDHDSILEEILRERKEWATNRGYLTELTVFDRYQEDTHITFAIPIEEIVPDNNLQRFLPRALIFHGEEE